MTKTRLENYIYLIGEIADLKCERAKLENMLNEEVTDTVQGSLQEYPFTSHQINISGRDKKTEDKLKRKVAEISAIEDRLVQEEKAIKLWIDTIPQSRMRRLMRYKYIEKKSWVRIAMMLKYDSADAARMAHNRFIEKNL